MFPALDYLEIRLECYAECSRCHLNIEKTTTSTQGLRLLSLFTRVSAVAIWPFLFWRRVKLRAKSGRVNETAKFNCHDKQLSGCGWWQGWGRPELCLKVTNVNYHFCCGATSSREGMSVKEEDDIVSKPGIGAIRWPYGGAIIDDIRHKITHHWKLIFHRQTQQTFPAWCRMVGSLRFETVSALHFAECTAIMRLHWLFHSWNFTNKYMSHRQLKDRVFSEQMSLDRVQERNCKSP